MLGRGEESGDMDREVGGYRRDGERTDGTPGERERCGRERDCDRHRGLRLGALGGAT